MNLKYKYSGDTSYIIILVMESKSMKFNLPIHSMYCIIYIYIYIYMQLYRVYLKYRMASAGEP